MEKTPLERQIMKSVAFVGWDHLLVRRMVDIGTRDLNLGITLGTDCGSGSSVTIPLDTPEGKKLVTVTVDVKAL